MTSQFGRSILEQIVRRADAQAYAEALKEAGALSTDKSFIERLTAIKLMSEAASLSNDERVRALIMRAADRILDAEGDGPSPYRIVQMEPEGSG